MPRAVSTWSLHRTLGNFVAPDSSVAGGRSKELPATDGVSLLELIPQLAAHGYDTLHLCHFHLASRDADYLASVRELLATNGITLDTFLIDDGDLTAPDADRHEAWYGEWLDVAAAVGAQRARIGAGRAAPTPELLAASGARLARLASAHPDVQVVTENWLEMTPDADSVLAVLDAAADAAGDSVGLLIDLGNWRGPTKYDDLAKLAPRAGTCHAKCHFTADGPDEDDFRRSLTVLQDAGFDGPLALIYDGPDADEWAGLDREWDILTSVFAQDAVSA